MTIREIRRQKNITQKQLAEAIGVTVGTISQYENETLVPTLNRLAMIAQALDVPMETIDITMTEYAGQLLLINSLHKSPTFFQKCFDRIILLEAEGKCEFCHNNAPFTTSEGKPYLKIYELEEPNGTVPEQNYAALCPNCYERLTILKEKDDIEKIKHIAHKHHYID